MKNDKLLGKESLWKVCRMHNVTVVICLSICVAAVLHLQASEDDNISVFLYFLCAFLPCVNVCEEQCSL